MDDWQTDTNRLGSIEDAPMDLQCHHTGQNEASKASERRDQGPQKMSKKQEKHFTTCPFRLKRTHHAADGLTYVSVSMFFTRISLR